MTLGFKGLMRSSLVWQQLCFTTSFQRCVDRQRNFSLERSALEHFSLHGSRRQCPFYCCRKAMKLLARTCSQLRVVVEIAASKVLVQHSGGGGW